MEKINIKNILFVEIEMVSEKETWAEVSDRKKILWENRTSFKREDELSDAEYYREKSKLYAEFSRVGSIVCGIITEEGKIRIKNFIAKEEKDILQAFKDLVESNYFSSNPVLCSYNAKEVTIPFLARRMVINGVHLPKVLETQGKKPWDIHHVDISEYWKFADYRNYTPMDLLAEVLGVGVGFELIRTEQIKDCFYDEVRWGEIEEYQDKKIMTLVNIFRKLRYEDILEEE